MLFQVMYVTATCVDGSPKKVLVEHCLDLNLTLKDFPETNKVCFSLGPKNQKTKFYKFMTLSH